MTTRPEVAQSWAERELRAERRRIRWILELLADGRADSAVLQIRADRSLPVDLLLRIAERVGNPIGSSEHVCCGCEAEDYGECSDCADMLTAHCSGCCRVGQFLKEFTPESPEAEKLSADVGALVDGCYGGLE